MNDYRVHACMSDDAHSTEITGWDRDPTPLTNYTENQGRTSPSLALTSSP